MTESHKPAFVVSRPLAAEIWAAAQPAEGTTMSDAIQRICEVIARASNGSTSAARGYQPAAGTMPPPPPPMGEPRPVAWLSDGAAKSYVTDPKLAEFYGYTHAVFDRRTAADQPSLPTAQMSMLHALLTAIRPRFGAPGSRDDDVAAIQRRIDASLAILSTPTCLTCNDQGTVGGPSYYAPDEGGVPCPDCATPQCAGHAYPLHGEPGALEQGDAA